MISRRSMVLALVGEEALLGEPMFCKSAWKRALSNWPCRRLEVRIGRDVADDFRVGNAEPHLLGALVDAGLGHHLAEHLPVEAERLACSGGSGWPSLRPICCRRSL